MQHCFLPHLTYPIPTNPLHPFFSPFSCKAATYAHPDKGGSEANMALLNEAYEVLTNPDLKHC